MHSNIDEENFVVDDDDEAPNHFADKLLGSVSAHTWMNILQPVATSHDIRAVTVTAINSFLPLSLSLHFIRFSYDFIHSAAHNNNS